MMSIRIRALMTAALVATPLAYGVAQREQTSDFRWSDRIDAGRLVKAGNVNGKVTVRQSTSDRVEVTAVKRWRKGDPASVRIEAKKVGNDIQICTLYDDQQSCDDRHENRNRRGRWNDDNNNDVSVDFTILVPRGVRVTAATVNGGVDIAGATVEVEAATVNGEVVVEAGGGPLTASTVNGSVRAKITSASTTRSMTFTSVNGNVVAEFAPSLGADIEMTTVNGELRSDFDLSVRGRIDPHNLSLHVGPSGGPRIRLTTVNGDVHLKKQ